MPPASALARFLLLSLTVAAVSSASAPAAFVHSSRHLHDSEETPTRRQHRHHEQQHGHADETSGDEQLVISNRAGTHVFWMHHGRAFSAQLGANRDYNVRDTFFVSEVCTCDNRRRPCHRSVCLKRFKPAFYAVVALASLLAVAGLATICCLVARAVRTRRRCVAVAAAKSPFSDRRSLIPVEVWGGSGDGQKLSIQCDPVTWDGENFQKIAL